MHFIVCLSQAKPISCSQEKQDTWRRALKSWCSCTHMGAVLWGFFLCVYKNNIHLVVPNLILVFCPPIGFPRYSKTLKIKRICHDNLSRCLSDQTWFEVFAMSFVYTLFKCIQAQNAAWTEVLVDINGNTDFSYKRVMGCRGLSSCWLLHMKWVRTHWKSRISHKTSFLLGSGPFSKHPPVGIHLFSESWSYVTLYPRNQCFCIWCMS